MTAPDFRRDRSASLHGAIDAVFGRWPAWPWSVLALIVAGGFLGAFVVPALRAATAASPAALGRYAGAGYGIVLVAFGVLFTRAARLLLLQSRIARRPGQFNEGWWPLRLLPAALASTPTLRLTNGEFAAAVDAMSEKARTVLAHRLWPIWAVAFTAPVLGLITAWQNGGTVQMRVRQDDTPATLLPAIISQVSPPMVATIAASLVLMVAVVMIDQWTKSLLHRWRLVVEQADSQHPAVVSQLGHEDPAVATKPQAPPPLPPPLAPDQHKLTTHPLDHEELARRWNQSE
jgi:hypothetical protein